MKIFYQFFAGFVLTISAFSQVYGQESLHTQIEYLASTIAAKINKSSIRSVGVADFTDLDGNTTMLGKYIADNFGIELINANSDIAVIDRSQLEFLLKENKLSLKGYISPETTSQLGKLTGIRAGLLSSK